MSNDFGIRLSQLGYNAETAADANLLYSSSWPLLKTQMEGSVEINTTTPSATIPHGLDYPPAFIFNVVYNSQSEILDFFNFTGTVEVDENNIYFNNSFGNPAVTIYYRIFRYDLTTNYTAPSVNLGTDTQASLISDTTFRIARSGKSVESTDLRDFAIHSDTRSPLIHQSVSGTVVPTTDTTGGFEVKAIHGLNYQPMFLAFSDEGATGRWETLVTGTGGASGIFTSTTSIKYGAASDLKQKASIIVLKDPFTITNAITVTI
jgi:hypothetical protein